MIAHDRGRSSVRDCSGMFIVVKDAVASMNCLGTLLEVFIYRRYGFCKNIPESEVGRMRWKDVIWRICVNCHVAIEE